MHVQINPQAVATSTGRRLTNRTPDQCLSRNLKRSSEATLASAFDRCGSERSSYGVEVRESTPDRDPIDSELRTGEQILWKGRPDPSRLFGPRDALLVPFSILWAGFAVFWEVGVIASGGPLFFVLWGIPFVAMGAFITVGRFFAKRARKKRTWYAITTNRVLVVESGRKRSVRELSIGQAGSIEYRPSSRGGDLVFGGIRNFVSTLYANTGMDMFTSISGGSPMAFFDVPDIDKAKAALDTARARRG